MARSIPLKDTPLGMRLARADAHNSSTKPAINRAFRIANNIPVEAKVNRLNGNHKIVTTAKKPVTPQMNAATRGEKMAERGGLAESRKQLVASRSDAAHVGDATGEGKALSDKAAVKSAHANAHPSLMGHTSAAKAHDAAAEYHEKVAPKGVNQEARSQAHRKVAEYHRAQAKIVSNQIRVKRIAAIKKIGPGQHHGVGGRFTGVAGGAKK